MKNKIDKFFKYPLQVNWRSLIRSTDHFSDSLYTLNKQTEYLKLRCHHFVNVYPRHDMIDDIYDVTFTND